MRFVATLSLTSPILRDPQALRKALAPVVEKTALEIERDIKERMREPKSGRASKQTRSLGLRERTSRGGNRLAIVGATFHRASAPGEAPAVDHGQLINSISTAKLAPLSRVVFTPMPYAWALEAGAYYSQLKSRRVVKIEPRPSFGPAVEAARPRFEQDCDAAIREVL